MSIKKNSTTNQELKKIKPDKNLQDDWIPNLERSIESTSKELTEYGGDLKEVESIPIISNREKKVHKD